MLLEVCGIEELQSQRDGKKECEVKETGVESLTVMSKEQCVEKLSSIV